MNKFIKKAVFIFVFATLLSASSAFAAFPFNTDPIDCPTVGIGNINTQAGVGNGTYNCWTLNSVSASAGHRIAVAVYYHNTSTADATNTKIKLNQSGSGTNYSFSGTLSADQGSTSFGPVSLNISSSQTLTLAETRWYANQNMTTPATLPFGQSGSEILSGGLNIGTIAPGGATQGYVVAIFTISNTSSTPCTINNFSANPSTINPGSSSILSWSTSNCTSVNIPGVGTFGPSGNATVTPSNTTTYTLNATGNNTATATTTVVVNSSSPCSVSSNASPSSITSGQGSTLYWSMTGANTVTISGVGTYNNSSGSVVVYPNSTTTYTFTATCTNGTTTTQTVTVFVNGGSNNITVDTYSPNNVDEDSATLEGYANGGGTTINTWFEFPCYGAQYGYRYGGSSINMSTRVYSLNPDTTYRYCAVAQSTSGGPIIRGNEVSFRTDDNSSRGPEVDTRSATNVDRTSATLNGRIDGNGDYTTRWFRYGTARWSLNLSTNTVNHGTGSRSVSDTVYNLDPNTTYYFQAVAQNSYDTVYGDILSFNTNASIINNGSTSAVTTVATGISQTGATLNGLLLNTTNLPTTVYFEYGPTVNMGLRTNSKNLGVGTSLNFSEYVTNLTPNTIYFFRAYANNANGTVFGIIEIFRTSSTGVVATTPVVVRTGIESPIMLKIENRYDLVSIGDAVDYTVTYKNIGSSKLTRPLLQVVMPKYIAYTNSSAGTFDAATNTLSVPLPDLNPNDGGTVYLQGRVVSLPPNHAEIVTTALLVYTTPKGAQENAIAYVINHENLNNLLGASAFFAGWFPNTLSGWLFWLLIILLILWIAREAFRRVGNNDNRKYYYNAPMGPAQPPVAPPRPEAPKDIPHT